jgi:hypothetical protein
MDVIALRRGLLGLPASGDRVAGRTAPAEATPTTRSAAAHGLRPEIQALRALAVSLVVAWPSRSSSTSSGRSSSWPS